MAGPGVIFLVIGGAIAGAAGLVYDVTLGIRLARRRAHKLLDKGIATELEAIDACLAKLLKIASKYNQRDQLLIRKLMELRERKTGMKR